MFKPRVLVLHGYGQTELLFRKKSKAIKQNLGKNYDLIYLEGPHTVMNMMGEPGKAWWTFDGNFFETSTYYGVHESLELIKQQIPFVGIIGFSQGAAFAAMLSGLYSLDFSIIIRGYPVSDLRYQFYNKIMGKMLHVYGEEDEIVVPNRSKSLYQLCNCQKQLISHSGRHIIPKLKYLDLLDQIKAEFMPTIRL